MNGWNGRRLPGLLILISLCLLGSGSRQQGDLVQIPACAWERGIGVPCEGAPALKRYIRGTSAPTPDEPFYQTGIPLGGLGAGNFEWTYYGNFNHWQLNIGTNFRESLPADQFSVFVQSPERKVAQVLYAGPGPYQWQWNYPVGAGTYYALYPRAWAVYDLPDLPVELAVEAFSPIIAHNYKETSYPVAIFVWRAKNSGPTPVTLSLMLTWANDFPGDVRRGHYNRLVEDPDAVAVVLDSADAQAEVREMDGGEFCVATSRTPGVTVSYLARWELQGDGSEVWADFADDGILSNRQDQRPGKVGAALAVRLDLAPGEQAEFPIVLAWDIPMFNFAEGSNLWFKYYTNYWGASADCSFDIAKEALRNYRAWEAAIEEWQRPIIEDPSRPDFYKCDLFNQLYRLGQGGTAWEAGGRFATISCFDYLNYICYDVWYKASFPLALLWPKIDARLQRDWSDYIRRNDFYVTTANGKPYSGNPWIDIKTEENFFRDTPQKFVLMVYRDYVYTQDPSLITYCWEAARGTMQRLREYDTNGDGLPEHLPYPVDVWDQTYDGWPMQGVSAYCGGLTLAALQAMEAMARLLGDETATAYYHNWYDTAAPNYHALLWNGEYFNFDTGSGPPSDSLMADMLAGQWYAEVCGLPGYASEEQIRSCLRKIYEFNVMRVGGGMRGAMNGMRPDGSIDMRYQASEVWPGTAYSVAAMMLSHGMETEAHQLLHGLYRTTYEDRGYWFNTPEAWNDQGLRPRAFVYMRPMAVWAVEEAYHRLGR